MIFLTVGSLFPFTRLVKAVDDAVANSLIDDKVFAQIGDDSYVPQNMEFVRSLEKREYDRYANDASALISHAGMGSISLALSMNKPLLVMPRTRSRNEHVNDHQVDTARRFESLGHVLVAYEVSQLHEKITRLHTFEPRARKTQVDALACRIQLFLEMLKGKE